MATQISVKTLLQNDGFVIKDIESAWIAIMTNRFTQLMKWLWIGSGDPNLIYDNMTLFKHAVVNNQFCIIQSALC